MCLNSAPAPARNQTGEETGQEVERRSSEYLGNSRFFENESFRRSENFTRCKLILTASRRGGGFLAVVVRLSKVVKMGMVNSKALWSFGLGMSALYFMYWKNRWSISRLLRWDPLSGGKMFAIRGLRNVGYTCYLNAVLQALSACAYFSSWLAHKDDLNKLDFPPRLHHPMQYSMFDYPITAVLYRAILVINRVIGNEEDEDDLMAKVPRDIIQTLHQQKHYFLSNKEQDTYECLQHILYALQLEVVRSIQRRQRGSMDGILDEDDASEVSGELISVSEVESESPYQSQHHLAAQTAQPPPHFKPRLSFSDPSKIPGWDVVYDGTKAIGGIYSKRKIYYGTVDTSLSLAPKFPFRGLTANVLQCLVCLHKLPVRFETFESLTLVVSQSPVATFGVTVNVRYLLKELQKPVIVFHVDCESCSKIQGKPTKSAFSKTMFFARLPSILVLHILQSEWRSYGLTKKDVNVGFEERMNLGDLTHWSNALHKEYETAAAQNQHWSGAGGDFRRTIAGKANCPEIIYDLKSFIAHSGAAAEGGHFATVRRVPETPLTKDHSRWVYVSDEYVSELKEHELREFKPYLLFYERHQNQEQTQIKLSEASAEFGGGDGP